MSETLHRIVELVRVGEVRLSAHGYDEIAEDGILARDVIDGMDVAVVIEEDPTYTKGPCVLVLRQDGRGRPNHVVRGISRGQASSAVLVTADRRDPARWTEDFLLRRQ